MHQRSEDKKNKHNSAFKLRHLNENKIDLVAVF